jgi:hypothetical protein
MPRVMPRLAVAVAALAIVLAAPAVASAKAYPFNITTKSCGTHGHHVRTTTYVNADTSCGFAWATSRKLDRLARQLKRYPSSMRVKSPVTGRTYVVVYQDRRERDGGNRGWVFYAGDGDNHQAIQVTIKWRTR